LNLLKTILSDIDHYYKINNIHFVLKPFGFLLICLPVSSLYSLAVYRFVTWINWKYGFYQTKSSVRVLLKIFYKVGVYVSVVFLKIQIEEDAQLGKGIWLSNRGGILLGARKMGDNCTISNNVSIGYGFGVGQKIERPVIGNNVWIGQNSVIYGDIKIGSGVTIKANSVIHKNIPPNCVVAGNPVRIKKHGNIKRIY
jgi:serine O-acetyltransferase